MTAEEHAAIQCYNNSILLLLPVCRIYQGAETAISVNKVVIRHAFQTSSELEHYSREFKISSGML